jgi:hypothetical protein
MRIEVRLLGQRPGMSPEGLRPIREDSLVTGEWTIAWGDDHLPVAVKDLAHLMERLAEAGKDAGASHTMVELVSPSGVACAIGLGRERSVVTFNASYAEPPYFISRGDLPSGGEALVFFYNGHWTGFGPEESVPTDQAVLAFKEFFETGERPSAVEFVEV